MSRSGAGTGTPASANYQPAPNPLSTNGDGTGQVARAMFEPTAYVTVAEATAWAIAHIWKTKRASWDDLIEYDRACLLQVATDHINALPLKGRKYYRDGTQINQFPREYRDGYDMNEATGVADVPQAVKDACCWEAIAILAHEEDEDAQERAFLKETGVSEYRLEGDYSEKIGASTADKQYGLHSQNAYKLLSKFIARSFPIV